VAKLEKTGFKKYWPMTELMGHAADGTRVTREVFRDMVTGEICLPVDKDGNFQGWNGEPTGAKPDQPVFSANDRYRANFDLIRWNHPSH